MKSLNNYIIQESLKEKIKGWIDKLKKSKEPEKIYKEEDIQAYKDKEITFDNIDDLIDTYWKVRHDKTLRDSEFEKNACKQGIFDYAWQNYHSHREGSKLRYDEFGDKYADSGYCRANEESGYYWNDVGVGMSFMEPFFWGWQLAKELNLIYTGKESVKIELNKFK